MSYKAEIDVEVLQVTDALILVTDGDIEGWIPKAILAPESEITKDSVAGDEGALVIPQWKAEKLGFV